MREGLKEIGQYIKTHRLKKCHTQLSLAVALGYQTPVVISDIERGRMPLPLKHLKKLCTELSIPENDLLGMLQKLEAKKFNDRLNGAHSA